MLGQVTGHDHPRTVVHGAGHVMLPHPGIDKGHAGAALLPGPHLGAGGVGVPGKASQSGFQFARAMWGVWCKRCQANSRQTSFLQECLGPPGRPVPAPARRPARRWRGLISHGSGFPTDHWLRAVWQVPFGFGRIAVAGPARKRSTGPAPRPRPPAGAPPRLPRPAHRGAQGPSPADRPTGATDRARECARAVAGV